MSSPTVGQVDHDSPTLRANAFHGLARAYTPPDTWPKDLPEALQTAFMPFGGEIAALTDRLTVLLSHEDNAPGKLSPVHARLFIGPFDIQAPPWASLYLDPGMQLMGESSRYAAEAYAEAGLGPVDGPTDAPDHVTHELEFMYFLAFQEYSTGDSVWLQRQESFWTSHLGRWLPQFAMLVKNSVIEASAFEFLSMLTLEFCKNLDTQFGKI